VDAYSGCLGEEIVDGKMLFDVLFLQVKMPRAFN
jgi:hypothetical protein